jgi:kynurenine formamidase
MSEVLQQLITDLASGRLRVVNLSMPLGPNTPIIELPPMFAQCPICTIDVISHYDERGPAWYWNVLNVGEHTGAHFDAPIHWVTGKDLPDNACDTIPAHKFIGLACVIDAVKEAVANPDFC